MSYALTGEFTVKEARNRGTKANPHGGELVKWYVDFLDSNGEPVRNEAGQVSDCYWQRKPGNDVNPGDTFYGVIEEGQHGLRFKKQQRPEGNEVATGTAGGRNASKGWQPEQERDPERSARILRQHSQEMALRFMELTNQSPGSVREIFQVANTFDQDVIAAGKAAAQGAGAMSPGRTPSSTGSQGNTPPASAPEQRPAEDSHQYFCKLLEDATLNPSAAHTLAGFIVEKFDAEQRTRAQAGLEDPSSQMDTLAKLRLAYEKATGELLPDPSDEDIPF